MVLKAHHKGTNMKFRTSVSILASVSLAIFFLGISISFGQKSSFVELPLTGFKLDEFSVSRFRDKDINEIIESIRKENLEVVLLKKPTIGKRRNTNLALENTADEQTLIELADRDERSISSKRAYGYFFPAYEYFEFRDDVNLLVFPESISEDQLKRMKSRPLLNKDLLILRSNSTRQVVIHEYMHFLFHENRKQPEFRLPIVGKISPKSVIAYQTNHSLLASRESISRLQKTLASLEETEESVTKSEELMRETARLWVKAQHDALDSILVDSAEEIDINLYLASHGEEFGFGEV